MGVPWPLSGEVWACDGIQRRGPPDCTATPDLELGPFCKNYIYKKKDTDRNTSVLIVRLHNILQIYRYREIINCNIRITNNDLCRNNAIRFNFIDFYFLSNCGASKCKSPGLDLVHSCFSSSIIFDTDLALALTSGS